MLFRSMLYRPLGADKPEMAPEDVAFMHEQLDPEIAALDREFGLDVQRRWDWH